ncbi:hypothetical protein AVEN_101502-1 [Araneus ventricosus]|uniref:Uncharacterized protein n=1 Tax=Araneus ventricosus TaxID=182803 RepID=A0A4Y2FC02_ARAVE|nr:hypothetical protein AVEN_101502-1 [Araneus ventricosus]
MSIDEDIAVAATLTDLEICQAVCEQGQALKIDDSDGDECVEENPPTNAEMMQAFDILKRGTLKSPGDPDLFKQKDILCRVRCSRDLILSAWFQIEERDHCVIFVCDKRVKKSAS